MSKMREQLLDNEKDEWIEIARKAITYNYEDLEKPVCPCSYGICSECQLLDDDLEGGFYSVAE